MMSLDATWLIHGARTLRRNRMLSACGLAIATALLLGAVALRAGASGLGIAAAALVGAILAAVRSGLAVRRSPITADLLAGYVDRAVTQAEESTGLLLREEADLGLLQRLQRRRTGAALARLAALPRLPAGPLRPLLRTAAALALAAAGVVLLPLPSFGGKTLTGPAGPAPGAANGSPNTDPAMLDLRLSIRPPAYTARPARRQAGWDAAAEEGAEIIWEFTVTGAPTGGRLVTAAGDTVALRRSGKAGYVAQLAARRSTLYRVLLDRPGRPPVASDDHRLTVRLDAAPILAVVRPGQRTAIRPGASMRLPVEVLASDDFGIDSAGIVATMTKGQGEGVKFREQRLEFESSTRVDARTVLLRRTLDLAALGLEPGDELYFHVVATDRRIPAPNQTRSETAFVTIVDSTGGEPIAGAGVALALPPDFFRSQRQLIIDTEKLLRDRPTIPAAVYRDRSNGLGIDQGLLRLRYGQFMGDEFDGGPVSGREAHAPTAEPQPPREPGEPEPDPMLEFRHDHDDAENATLLAPKIKAMLRDAITQMWSSELHLRTADPKTSLPFQYRALARLQEIRQNARAYVQRVGFDPPPLEPDRKRLTGDLTRVATPVRDAVSPDRPSAPAIRAGIGILQRLRAGSGPRPGDRDDLEAAGAELARLAVDDPVHLLGALRALRLAIRAFDSTGNRCADCLGTAERGFWRALPAPLPGAGAAPGPAGGLAREYYRLLSGRQ